MAGSASMPPPSWPASSRSGRPAGVAILVDLGGAEMNSDMAVEMLDEARRPHVRICAAPIVEGAVIAATEASSGSTLDEVVAAAEAMG